MQVTSGDILCYSVEEETVFEVVHQLKHVRDLTTAELPHHFNLSVGFLQLGECCLDEGFIGDFNDDFLPRVYMPTKYYFSEGACSKRLFLSVLTKRSFEESLAPEYLSMPLMRACLFLK